MKQFGDLSGNVKKTYKPANWWGGHQRLEAFKVGAQTFILRGTRPIPPTKLAPWLWQLGNGERVP